MMSLVGNVLLSFNRCRTTVYTKLYQQGLHFHDRSSNQLFACRRTMSDSKTSGQATGSAPSPWQQGFYKYFLPIQTRLGDTDWFGHVNNVVYYSFFDTVINHYLIRHCGLRHPKTNPSAPNIVGFMVDTRATYKQPINYPEVILAGMAVTKLGNSSVTYTVGIFAEKETKTELSKSSLVDGILLANNETANFDSHVQIASAVGQCVHVFVDLNGDQKPVRIPDVSRIPLRNIMVPLEDQISKL